MTNVNSDFEDFLSEENKTSWSDDYAWEQRLKARDAFCNDIAEAETISQQGDLEKFLLGMLMGKISKRNLIDMLLKTPGHDDKHRLVFFEAEMKEHRQLNTDPDDYKETGHYRFVQPAVEAAKKNSALAPLAEKICLHAVTYKTGETHKVGMQGLATLYADKPLKALAIYKAIVEAPEKHEPTKKHETYPWYAKKIALYDAARIVFKDKQYMPQAIHLSLHAMSTKGETLGAASAGFENMERFILDVPYAEKADHWDLFSPPEDAYTDRNGIKDLHKFGKEKIDKLAQFYYKTYSYEPRFLPNVRIGCLERATQLVEYDPTLAELFQPMFIKACVDNDLGYDNHHYGWTGLKTIKFPADENALTVFKGVASEMNDPVFVQASLDVFKESAPMLAEENIAPFCKKIRKMREELTRRQEQKKKIDEETAPTPTDIALKNFEKLIV